MSCTGSPTHTFKRKNKSFYSNRNEIIAILLPKSLIVHSWKMYFPPFLFLTVELMCFPFSDFLVEIFSSMVCHGQDNETKTSLNHSECYRLEMGCKIWIIAFLWGFFFIFWSALFEVKFSETKTALLFCNRPLKSLL